MSVYVVGHKNPDTDSIVSAIALAEAEGYIPARSGDLNNETLFALKEFGFKTPELLPAGEKQVVLVDNNGNPEELADGVNPEDIIMVFDHHKLGGLKTPSPIMVWCEPVGSTATIIANHFELRGQTPTKEIASLLLCGIISDTLNFTSPTTTDRDHDVAKGLNKIAEVDMNKLAEALFAAKSDISDIKTEELLTKDCKTFEMGVKKVAIGVWETTLPETVLARKTELIECVKAEKLAQKLDYMYFVVVDIINQKSHFIIASEAEGKVAEAVFDGKVSDGILVAEGVVSRKKQITPPLEKYIRGLV